MNSLLSSQLDSIELASVRRPLQDQIGGITEDRIVAMESDIERLAKLLISLSVKVDQYRRSDKCEREQCR